MARADLQTAERRLRRLEELVADQKLRAAAFRDSGKTDVAERATALLGVFEDIAAAHRRRLADLRQRHGV